jgi:Porin subfamily
MKMVKSLLLGSAAGLVAVAGAQAADLPVKAAPVQYVKICSLYGVGFYYIPGTDMCIKIGGWVRAEYGYGQNGNFAWGWANANANNRTTNNSDFRARGYITADSRNQTEYGTVRGYIAIGLSENDVGFNTASNTFSANRAFIQWAGFTFGRAQSFYDFYSVPATSYWGAFPASDTGDPGWFVMGYTAQFGNGFSATISAEERRVTSIINLNTIAGFFAPGTPVTAQPVFTTSAYGGFQAPDIVGNLRIDQAWGSAQIMGALHEVNSTYYNNSAVPIVGNAAGGPDNKLGWVVGAGFKLNTPWLFNWLGTGVGDYFQTQVNYTEGALRYIFQTPNSNWGFTEGNSQSLGLMTDAVYGGTLGGLNTTGLNLTTAWNVNAAYEHFWSPRWRTSLYGGYAEVSYGSAANNMMCAAGGFAVGAGLGAAALAAPGCDMNWNTYWIGSRTQWNVTKDFYMGVDVLYQKMNSGTTPTGILGGNMIQASGAVAPVFVDNPDNWSFRFRVHRDFYP